MLRRSPCGERGLKCPCVKIVCEVLRSLPVRGAWIEMGEDIHDSISFASLPVRGAWIEMSVRANRRGFGGVAPRAGSVD